MPFVRAPLFSNRDQAALGPDIPAAIDERRRGERTFPNPIDMKQLKRRTRPQYERFTIVIGEEDFAVDRNR